MISFYVTYLALYCLYLKALHDIMQFVLKGPYMTSYHLFLSALWHYMVSLNSLTWCHMDEPGVLRKLVLPDEPHNEVAVFFGHLDSGLGILPSCQAS